MKKIRILIADDHAIVRTGLATLLKSQHDMDIVGLAATGRESVSLAKTLSPDVVIMDLVMPILDGADAIKEIHSFAPNIGIIILTTFATSDGIARALDAGAIGALLKDADNEDLYEAIRKVSRGMTAVSADIRRLLKNDPPVATLTDRQAEILDALAHGLSSKEIATLLNLKPDSVDKRVNATLIKLGASSRAEAVAIALRKHLLKI